MKRIIIMLLIVSSAVATAQAQQKIYANTPQQVISQLEYMINMYGLTFASPHESLAGDVVYGLPSPENPELRDVYAIVWAVDYMGGEPTATRGYPMNGTVYMITSLRPDIYEKEAKQSGDNVIQDLYSKLVPGLAPSFRPTPEQMKLIMQKAPAIRDIMVDIEKAYAPLDREQSLHRLDMAFEQIAKKNKELDQQWQDLVKSLKDLKTPSEETKRTIDVLYNVILTFCTQQNKIFTEMYKRRGSLPISGQNAQKYINELTEKYMKEMDKFLKDTK